MVTISNSGTTPNEGEKNGYEQILFILVATSYFVLYVSG